jgi:hypothetical protein
VHHFEGRELVGEQEGGKALLYQEALDKGKKYLLEVNPSYTNASTKDSENVIDARWIDTATGLFIDITTLHVQPTLPSPDSQISLSLHDHDHSDDLLTKPLYTKDTHFYPPSTIFPLRTTTFENITVSIPYAYEDLLIDEYGAKALTQRRVQDFMFVERKGEGEGEGKKEWVLVDGFGEEVAEEDEEAVLRRLRAAREKMDYLERVEGRKGAGKGRFDTVP